MFTKVAEKVAVKEASPQIHSISEHPGYRDALAKQAELSARREAAIAELDRAGASLAEHRASAVDREASAVLSGNRPAGTEINLAREISHLQNTIEVFDRAMEKQGITIQEQRELACKEVMQTMAPEYEEIQAEYRLLLKEAWNLRARRTEWVSKVMSAGIKPASGCNAFILGGYQIPEWNFPAN